jgi:hypothetical protein
MDLATWKERERSGGPLCGFTRNHSSETISDCIEPGRELKNIGQNIGHQKKMYY